MLSGTTLDDAPVTVLHKIRSPLTLRDVDQIELSFFISFTLSGSWMLTSSTKKLRSEYYSQSLTVC